MRVTARSRFRHVLELALLVAGCATPFSAQSPQLTNPQSEEPGSGRRAVRVKILIGASQQMTFDTAIQSVTIVDPQSVKATVIGERVLLLTGLDFGESIVVVSTNLGRETLIAEIIGRPIETPAADDRTAKGKSPTARKASFGSYTVAFTAPSSKRSALLSQSLQYRQTLNSGRTLDLETSLFSTFGGQSEPLLAAEGKGVGVNRLSLALRNSDSSSLEILDNEITVSPLTFSGYTIRGLHVTTARNSILRGSEFFAGLARPSISLLNLGGGRIIGGVVPLTSARGWTIRAGAMAVNSSGSNDGHGGPIFLVDANYRHAENTLIQGELSYGGNAISWRGAAVIQRGPFNFSGEVAKLDNRSPVIAVGAQGRGRSTLSGSLQWQPSARFVAFTSYSRNRSNQSSTSARISLSGATLAAGLNYRFGKKTHFGFRYSQQAIDAAALSSFASQIRTRTLSANLSTRFSRHWENTLETRYSHSSEARADAEMDRGYGFRDELRRSWEWASGSAYFNYQNSGQSLSSLIIRNPSLLPPLIRHEFEADPSRFLIMNRDLLSTFLGGIELPQAKSTDAGLRFQASLSKYSLIGELRYSNSEFGTQLRRDLLTTVNLGVRLNSANSINFSSALSRPLESSSLATANGFSSLTTTLTHRFGGSSDGGFFLTRLLGLNHGAIKGRVFSDINSNGKDDPEEPGIAGLKVRLDNGNTATTDPDGHFRFAGVKPGNITVSLLSDDLGRRMRASTTNQQTVSVAPRETVNLSFGFFNFGFIAGRIFNDLKLSGKPESNDPPGISGVSVRLLPENSTTANSAVTRVTDGSGIYEFRSLAPGKYTIQLDPDTLPPNFRAPVQTSWQLTVEAITGSYLDIPLVAQRRVSGVVFIDKDNDGKFDSQIDEAVAGAHVVAGRVDVVTGPDGAYLLRGLPAGNLEIVALAPWGGKSAAVAINLDPEPSIKRGVDLSVPR